MKCHCQPCDLPPHCDCQWGSNNLPTQTATLCEPHANDLWQRLNHLLELNLAWYRIDSPGNIDTP